MHVAFASSRRILKRLQQGGWRAVRITTIVVPHPKKDLPRGLVRKIYKDAGWRP
jgi:predicted RNA binding protein YcfA (HicA-like mRNA interferase family)